MMLVPVPQHGARPVPGNQRHSRHHRVAIGFVHSEASSIFRLPDIAVVSDSVPNFSEYRQQSANSLHGNEGAAAAGHVIEAFGQFVVGGNYVVGFVIFLALIAIQYLVINHGAVRTAEVAARFTLDALPESRWQSMRT